MEALAERTVRHHQAQVYRYLRRRTGSADQAEELTQEVFADAAAALARLPSPPTEMLAWLYTIAQRRFIDQARCKQRRATVVPLDEVAEVLPAHEHHPGTLDALRAALQRLPDAQRQVVQMKLFEGRSFSEIAGRLGTTEAATKMRFGRALRGLRADLEQQGIGP